MKSRSCEKPHLVKGTDSYPLAMDPICRILYGFKSRKCLVRIHGGTASQNTGKAPTAKPEYRIGQPVTNGHPRGISSRYERCLVWKFCAG